ncbi:hypothetical protein [Aeromonas taiwanensis]|uniref:hypothetical protein n=1 Tax=Aeromonas taiwanensis TaxID=633417 RepID=UPI00248E1110|nr:hypothetical protein [Aeromonas taiwanensis]
MPDHTAFIPFLTVMVDYGWTPFLWLKESPDEPSYVSYCECIGDIYCEDDLISEELWALFSPWAREFDQTMYNSHALDPEHWNWEAFHARGLQLTRLLKAEVGDSYRVLYLKPYEGPTFKEDEYREVLADGTIVPFHPDRDDAAGS